MELVAVAYTVSLSFAKIVQTECNVSLLTNCRVPPILCKDSAKKWIAATFRACFSSPMANLFVSMGADRV